MTTTATEADWERITRARQDLAARVEDERFREECFRDRADYDPGDPVADE
ncbi:hypothetical protein [Microbispora sp. CA-102843]